MTDKLKFILDDLIIKTEILDSKFIQKKNSNRGNEVYLFDYFNSLFVKNRENDNNSENKETDEEESILRTDLRNQNLHILFIKNPNTNSGKLIFKQNVRKDWIRYQNVVKGKAKSFLYDLTYNDFVEIIDLYSEILEIPKNKFWSGKITQIELGANLSFGTKLTANERISLGQMLSCFGKYKNVPEKYIYGNSGVCFKADNFEISIYDKIKRVIATKEMFRDSSEKRKKLNREKLRRLRFVLRYEFRVLSEAHFNQSAFSGKIDTLKNLKDNWDLVLQLLYNTTDNIEFYDFLSPEIEKHLMDIGLKSKGLSEFNNYMMYRGYENIGYENFRNHILPLVNKSVKNKFEKEIMENNKVFRDITKYKFSYQKRFLRALDNRLESLKAF